MNNSTLPILFREALFEAGMPAIDQWWRDLDDLSRDEALQLWDECNQEGDKLSVRVEARFVEYREDLTKDYWYRDFYEYLINHEVDVSLYSPRPFHVCSEHPAANQCARDGFIPGNFRCPLSDGDCLMEKLLNLSKGKSIRFEIRLARSKSHCPP